MKCLYTSSFTETPSLERLPTKTTDDPSPNEIKLSLAGHQPSISWSWVIIIIITIIIIIIILLFLLLLLLLLLLLSF